VRIFVTAARNDKTGDFPVLGAKKGKKREITRISLIRKYDKSVKKCYDYSDRQFILNAYNWTNGLRMTIAYHWDKHTI
jgi:hypothetical protein